MNNEYKIGTKFKKIARKNDGIWEVIDVLKTYNSKNELVSIRYVVTTEFMGQVMTDRDVVAVTIARGFDMNKIKIVKISPSMKRLIVYCNDEKEDQCLDFNTPDEALGVLKNMSESLPYKFWIEDVLQPTMGYWSKRK